MKNVERYTIPALQQLLNPKRPNPKISEQRTFSYAIFTYHLMDSRAFILHPYVFISSCWIYQSILSPVVPLKRCEEYKYSRSPSFLSFETSYHWTSPSLSNVWFKANIYYLPWSYVSNSSRPICTPRNRILELRSKSSPVNIIKPNY